TPKPAEKISTADARVAGASFMSVRREHVDPPAPTSPLPAKRSFRLGVELKALLPVAAALLNGLLLFLLVRLSWNYPQRHAVISVAAAGAVAICVVVFLALVFLVKRPMRELHREIARVGE